MLERQPGRVLENILEHHVESRCQSANQWVGHAPDQGGLPAAQELVEDEDAAARLDDPFNFA